MSRDEIIRMALEAGMDIDDEASGFGAIITAEPSDLERFAALVASAEREACAKVCEELRFSELGPSPAAKHQRDLCATAIRARGETK